MELSAKDITERPGIGGELNAIDKRLLEMASKRYTGEMMASDLGGLISAERAMQRVREIIKSQDWLSIVELQGLIVNDMIDIRNHLFEMMYDEDEHETASKSSDRGDSVSYHINRNDPRWSANLIKLLKDFGGLLLEMQKQVSADKTSIREAHAQLMIDSISLAFRRLMFDMSRRFTIIQDVNAKVIRENRELLDAHPDILDALLQKLPDETMLMLALENILPRAFEEIEEARA